MCEIIYCKNVGIDTHIMLYIMLNNNKIPILVIKQNYSQSILIDQTEKSRRWLPLNNNHILLEKYKNMNINNTGNTDLFNKHSAKKHTVISPDIVKSKNILNIINNLVYIY